MKLAMLALVVAVSMGTLINYSSAAESGSQAIELGGDAAPGWRSSDEVKKDFDEGLSLGVSFWWILVFFVVSAALLIWLAVQQNRGGRWFVKDGRENIEVVARRMFGSRHGVICVRLRDREFLLGIGGDNVSLISEWRIRERSGGDGGEALQQPAGKGEGDAGGAAF